MNYIITGETYNGKFVEQQHTDIRILSTRELDASDIRFGARDKLYIPSETALSGVLERMDDPAGREGILVLKDKYKCREILRSMYPDFYFQKLYLEELLSMKSPDRKIIIKPQKGFFGTGVRTADPDTDMIMLAKLIRQEIEQNSRFFPESILSKDEFLIEEYVEAEEYAVDMFYDELGRPCIMNIYHHPEPAEPHYAHLMYYSYAELFQKHLVEFTSLFEELGKHTQLRNFPIHAEFKRKTEGFIPIEFNPMRYGGFGLADLGNLSYSMQAISAYFAGVHPDWDEIWADRQNMYYAFILAYNGKDIDVTKASPNHDIFRKYLLKHCEIMDYVELDHSRNPVFAIAYVKTDVRDSLTAVLNTEFNDFFEKA